MQRNLNTPHRWSRALRWGTIAVAAMTITACGPLGDDEDEPTATAEVISQPTTASLEDPVATPPIENIQPGVSFATPEVGFSTPIVSNPVDPVASQASPEAQTPTVADPPADDVTGTGAQTTGPVFSGSDGTSGATPVLGGAPVEPDLAGTPVAEETSPDPGSTPVTGEPDELEPQAVTSCAPDSIPPFGGEQANFLTNTDVNFRAGPGSDCELVADEPIGTNISVTVLSGPVIREDGDGFEWVQVQIIDQTGWVVLEVLDPAP